MKVFCIALLNKMNQTYTLLKVENGMAGMPLIISLLSVRVDLRLSDVDLMTKKETNGYNKMKYFPVV